MKTKIIVSIFALTAMLYGCTSTKIVSSWRDPNTTVQEGQFKKVLIVALVQNESTRRTVEDQLVAHFKGNAVASYNYLKADEMSSDSTGMKVKFMNDGFDGMITMQLVKVDKDVNYVPGSYPTAYYSPWGYGAYAWGAYSTPGYYTVDDNYKVETNVYKLSPQKLVWSGVTSTLEPGSVEKAVSEIVAAIKEEMEEEGFLKTAE